MPCLFINGPELSEIEKDLLLEIEIEDLAMLRTTEILRQEPSQDLLTHLQFNLRQLRSRLNPAQSPVVVRVNADRLKKIQKTCEFMDHCRSRKGCSFSILVK